MEEGTKLRLVRCPKCENVLPELPNLAVYQCGGCGAVLQAKTPQISSGGSSEKSDDENERVRVGSEKVESFAEKGEEEGDMSGSSEVSDRVSNGIEIRQTRRERGLPNGTNDLNSSSSSRIVNKVVSNENILVSKYDGRSEEHEMARVDKYRRPLKSPVDSWVTGNDQDINRSREKSFDPQMEIASGSKRSGQIPNWRPRERDGSTAYRRTPRAVAEDVRFSGSAYPDEGTSSYPPDSYGLVEPLRNSNISGGAGRVEHLEQDRAELLRKLDELNLLKDQLARSCVLPDNTKERVPLDGRTIPVDPYVGRESWFPEGSSRQHGPSVQPFAAEKHAQRPLHSNHGLEPIPLINRHGMDMQNFYPPMMHEIPGYGDPFSPQMVGPNKLPHQYQQHPSHDYYSAQYVDMDPDHNASYPANTFFHQPACSCPHCYNKHWHASAQIPPGVLNRRFLDAPANPMFYHAESRGTYNPRGYDPRDANPPPMRREHHLRRQRDLDTETTGFGQSRPRRVLPVKRNGRRCCPIAGGAPFITCHNCFELLPLPKKLLIVEKNYQKVRCGSCSTIISLLFEGKSIIVSVPEQTKGLSPVVDVPSIGIEKEGHLHSHAQADHGGAYSSDYDSSGYNFHMTDIEPGSSSMDRRLNLSESEKLQSLASSCSTTSEDEESPDSVIARREVSNSAEPPLKAKGTPPFPGSPLPEYSSSNQVGGKFEKGNRSKRISQEEAVMAKATSRQNSVKDASMATEMDVSFTEYSNGGMSQEYGEVSREDQPRASKGGESFFAGLIKKSFRSHQSGEHDRSNITINAHPISERLVKKAEKQAGPIHPGQYWYDFRAGFWGVFGQPCLGIIPPFIEEFNYPMPKNCAGGNTGVYVNGRELHQKDLDLLANRGLPTDTDKSYIIEISGRVLDEDSGEECENLGKLAPTVEKLKHGFGMRVPRSAAV